MKTENRTALPWTFDETWSLIMSGDIEVAALHSGEAANVKRVNRSIALDNAAFIVRAVNNHDNLVNLVQRLLDNAEIDALNEPELEPLCEQARAALKAVKGED